MLFIMSVGRRSPNSTAARIWESKAVSVGEEVCNEQVLRSSYGLGMAVVMVCRKQRWGVTTSSISPSFTGQLHDSCLLFRVSLSISPSFTGQLHGPCLLFIVSLSLYQSLFHWTTGPCFLFTVALSLSLSISPSFTGQLVIVSCLECLSLVPSFFYMSQMAEYISYISLPGGCFQGLSICQTGFLEPVLLNDSS